MRYCGPRLEDPNIYSDLQMTAASVAASVDRLKNVKWDFRDADTSRLTHRLHPYPAKFIPQIPRALIDELSAPGEVVADIFCGSGTTLVEALALGRNAIGVDANPLACLISTAKTLVLRDETCQQLAEVGRQLQDVRDRQISTQPGLFIKPSDQKYVPASDDKLAFWFDPHVIAELGEVRQTIARLPEQARLFAEACFSSIVVGVSKQDSDTRYVRREKNITTGETLTRFLRTLSDATAAAKSFAEVVRPDLSCRVIHSNVLDRPDVGPVDLVVCSPPYPNAYSYHLYHRTRMQWLGMDQLNFKRHEIGSHRKYSSPSPKSANVATFQSELSIILDWLSGHLRSGRYACFVIGDSLIKGQTIRNDELLIDVARDHGFTVEANLERTLQETRKAFNPRIGRIRQEHIVILQRNDR